MTDPLALAQTPITVFVHVHYPEIWREMSLLLAERLVLPFHLVVTTSHPESEIAVPPTPALLSTRILRLENRGRDILPFLQALAQTPDVHVGLKLHTKKSPQREDGAQWRAAALRSLLPSLDGTAAIVTRMRSDCRLGIVAPAGFCLSVSSWILVNARPMEAAMSALGYGFAQSELEDVFFAAGSMFWFRRHAIEPLVDKRLMDLFEAESGQFDGTIAHAMERLFPVVARQRGYLSLAVDALISSSVMTPTNELLELARRHADVPSSYFVQPQAADPSAPAAEPRVRDSGSRLGALLVRACRLGSRGQRSLP